MITKFINEIVFAVFGVVIVAMNLINAGPLEVTILGALLVVVAVLLVVVPLLEKKPAKKTAAKK